MESIAIQPLGEESNAAKFRVTVGGDGGTAHDVTIPRDYFDSLDLGDVTAEQLLEKSFEFLLIREPKEMILRTFSIEVIEEYFSEYRPVIKKMIEGK